MKITLGDYFSLSSESKETLDTWLRLNGLLHLGVVEIEWDVANPVCVKITHLKHDRRQSGRCMADDINEAMYESFSGTMQYPPPSLPELVEAEESEHQQFQEVERKMREDAEKQRIKSEPPREQPARSVRS